MKYSNFNQWNIIPYSPQLKKSGKKGNFRETMWGYSGRTASGITELNFNKYLILLLFFLILSRQFNIYIYIYYYYIFGLLD